MVLHNNKWDRKQNRDRVRKLRAKGKDDPAFAAAVSKNGGRHEKDKFPKGSVLPPTAGGSATDSEAEESEEEGKSKEEGEKTEINDDGGRGVFSRRKVASNAWRYEEEEPEFPNGAATPPEEEPEEDYVALTLSRTGGQLKDADRDELEKARKGVVDAAFLNESWGKTWKQQQEPGDCKGKVLKVDKKDFVDITEKIAKQKNVDAFRARFGSKTKPRAPKVLGGNNGNGGYDGNGDGGEDDDLDAFLGELNLDGGKDPGAGVMKLWGFSGPSQGADLGLDRRVTGSATHWRESSAPEPRKSCSEQKGNDDEWLDQMLGDR